MTTHYNQDYFKVSGSRVADRDLIRRAQARLTDQGARQRRPLVRPPPSGLTAPRPVRPWIDRWPGVPHRAVHEERPPSQRGRVHVPEAEPLLPLPPAIVVDIHAPAYHGQQRRHRAPSSPPRVVMEVSGAAPARPLGRDTSNTSPPRSSGAQVIDLATAQADTPTLAVPSTQLIQPPVGNRQTVSFPVRAIGWGLSWLDFADRVWNATPLPRLSRRLVYRLRFRDRWATSPRR